MPKIDEETAREWIGAQSAAGRESARLTVDVAAGLHKQLRLFCAEHDVKLTALLRALAVEALTDDKLAERVIKRAGGA